MFNKLFFFLLMMGAAANALAQSSIRGKVVDADTQLPLEGAAVFFPLSRTGATTDANGQFAAAVPPGEQQVRISFVGYAAQTFPIGEVNDLIISLLPETNLEELVIQAIRNEGAPIAQTTVGGQAIKQQMIGQDAPFLLERLVPSVVAYSESGTNFSNYGQFRLRGIDQSRVNITLNGIPLNDMIDQGVFFSNFSDFSNNVSSVQVQRGVGTSTNGTASFAGSVNFESVSLRCERPTAEVELSAGSFGTYRGSAAVHTGLMDNNVAMYARFTNFQSDGYKHNSASQSYSFFGSVGYFGKKDLLKITAFSGRSQNGLAYLPIALTDIEADPRTNYVHPNDTDDFGQQFLQIQHTRAFNRNWSVVSSLYYGGANGDYPVGFDVVDSIYSTVDGQPTATPVTRFTQINYPLTNRHYGGMTNWQYTSNNQRLNVHTGFHAYTFRRENLESILPDNNNPYYRERSWKDEASFFAKANYAWDRLTVYADLQFRAVWLTIDPDATLLPSELNIVSEWNFLNPRVGLTYALNPHQQLFASFGRTGREPTKVDLLGGFQLNAANVGALKAGAVKPEFVNDWEAGVDFSYVKFKGQVNAFYMQFRNEIAPIGAYVPEGFLQLRKNMPESYRAGVELAGEWLLSEQVSVFGNATYMRARIREYAPEGAGEVFENVAPALSPEWMGQGGVRYRPAKWLEATAQVRHVGESFQEPTNDARFAMPAFWVADASVSLMLGKHHRLDFFLNNLLNERYYTFGAPLDTDFDGTFDQPGFFVQPPRHVFGKYVVRF